jgi:formate hydrogenlyase subunit 3/multisubunit Na+/H+ antiporter MnhD subunit
MGDLTDSLTTINAVTDIAKNTGKTAADNIADATFNHNWLGLDKIAWIKLIIAIIIGYGLMFFVMWIFYKKKETKENQETL